MTGISAAQLMINTATTQTEKLTNDLAGVRQKQRGVEICKRKLLDRSLEEPSEKETRHNSLPNKSSDTSKFPKKEKKLRGNRKMTRTN